MKQKAILVITFLIFILCIITPVSSYTLVSDYTLTEGSGYTSGRLVGVGTSNYSGFNTLTRLEWSGHCYFQVGPLSGTENLWLKKNVNPWTHQGNVTYTWSAGGYNNISEMCNIALDFSDLTLDFSTTYFVLASDQTTQFIYNQNILGHPSSSGNPPSPFTTGLDATNWMGGDYHLYTGTAVNVPVASFTCVPTSQYLSTDVVCTDTSTNTPTSWLWTIDGFGVNGWQTSTTQDFSWQSSYAGTFSVNLQATNGAGSDWENKTNYITIQGTPPGPTPTPYQIIDPVAAGHIRTWFINSDGQTGGSIQGSFIDLYDVQNTSWRNTTLSMSVNGNLAYIDTHPDHTINAYGHAVGYDSDTRMGLPAADTVYELILWSGSIPSPSAGNVNLFVIVSASPSGMALTNAQVTASKPGGGWDAVLTGISGTASFVEPNMSLIYVSASKSGYGTVTTTITTTALGPDTLRITLPKLTVTPTITATPLPGEATARPTYAPGCDPSAYDAAICNTGKDSAMMDQIRDAGPTLIGLAIIATMFGLIKLMTKK